MASKEGGNRDRYCCVPNCKGNGRRNPELSFHQIPKRLELRKAWIHAIRRDPGPLFRIGPHTVVCSRHFKKDDFKWAPIRKTLKKESVPSIFDWKSDKPARREILKHPVPEKMPRLDTADNNNRDSTENSNEGSGNVSTASGRSSGMRCVAAGCSTKTTSNNGMSLHGFPLNRPAILRQWVNFVREKRPDWSGPTKFSVLCPLHFMEECYPTKFRLIELMGVKLRNKTLEWDAVPTIQTASLSSNPRRSLRLALQTRDADRTPKKTKVSRARKKLALGRLRKCDIRRKEVLDRTSVLSKPSDTSYAVYIDNPEEQPSDVSAMTGQVALPQWNSGIVPVDTEETSVNRPGTTELVALSQLNSGIDVCEDLKPIVLNPVTSTTEENGCTMSFPQNQDVCSDGKCVETIPEFVCVKREPECSFSEIEPENIVVKGEPENIVVKSEQECSYVKSEPECSCVKSEPKYIVVNSEPGYVVVKSEPECSYVKNESENTWVLVKTMIGNLQATIWTKISPCLGIQNF